MQIQIGETVREMTDEEIENYETVISEAEKAMAQTNTFKTALKNKLVALGLTAAEVAALVG